MVTFKIGKVSERITRITSVNNEHMYLVEGENRAALIDSGPGVGDLMAEVRKLTSLPVMVLLTHGHVDHAFGAGQFDEVYLSSYDLELYREQMDDEIREIYYSDTTAKNLLEDKDYVSPFPAEKLQPVRDGQLFDLGGITVEAVALPGHTLGFMMFLIREERTLVAGDGCTFFTMLQADICPGIYSYRRNLRAAMLRIGGRYEHVLMSHSSLEAPSALLEEVMEVCDLILAGKDDHIPFRFWDMDGFVAKAYGYNGISYFARKDGKIGNLVYNEKKIWL